MNELVVGIFVGGAGARLGGVAKGLLKTRSGATIIERLISEIRAALPDAELVLVGETSAYGAMNLRRVADQPAGIGPLGGLCGLLALGRERTLVLPCDLPRIESSLIARLATEAPDADALIVEQAGVRNPLIARYRGVSAFAAAQRALSRGKRSLQAVLDELGDGVRALSLNDAELDALQDWDTPEDMARDSGIR